jgi:hypothetical protein
MLALAGCRSTGTAATETRLECLAFALIRWSAADTQQTVRQIVEHNAAWDALCGQSVPPR